MADSTLPSEYRLTEITLTNANDHIDPIRVAGGDIAGRLVKVIYPDVYDSGNPPGSLIIQTRTVTRRADISRRHRPAQPFLVADMLFSLSHATFSAILPACSPSSCLTRAVTSCLPVVSRS